MHGQTHPQPKAPVEPLERRQLLSASLSGDLSANNISAANVMRAYPAHEGITASPAFAAGSNGPVGFSPAQVRAAYGIDGVTFDGTAGTGAGQTIAVVVAYDDPKFVDTGTAGFAASDLHAFDQQFGIADPPSFTKVDQNGSGTSLPGTDPTGGWEDETSLDVEWAHATAPAANLVLVECYSDGLNDLIQGGVQYARNRAGVSVVSMSFAAPEAASETTYDPDLTTPAGHQGVTFLAAAGDSGSPAEYPAASPDVVGVGGTTVSIYGTSYSGETGLSNGGGGVSAYEPKPAYQFGLTQSATRRETPDVSFEANHNANGNDVYDSYNGGADPWYSVGGTSFAVPVWAGLVAQADQGRAKLGYGTMDGATQTLPRLYYLNQSDFHDVTTGNNGNPAGAGYDLVTGRGTPVANKLVPDLAGGASVSGQVYLDNNENGKQDAGEAGLAGVSVYLDLYDDGVAQGADPLVQTDASGDFRIGELPGGTYRLETVGLTSYHKTTAAYYTVVVGYGQAVVQQQVGEHYDTGTISGYVFEDLTDSRSRANNDPGYGNWVVYLDNNLDGSDDAGDTKVTTNGSGYFAFANLRLGSVYYVRQDIPAGYSRTTLGGGATADVALFGGTTTFNIGYVPNTASISGNLFADPNGNGKQDPGEAGLSGVRVYLDLNGDGSYTPGVDYPVTTGVNGTFTIAGLAPGTYILNQVLPPYYAPTNAPLGGFHVVVGVAQAVTGQDFADRPPS